jgi:hypothetical protein
MMTTPPAETPAGPLRPEDLEHLRLLAIFHYVVAGMQALFACLPLIHLTVGIAMLTVPKRMGSDGAEGMVGWMFVVMATVFILAGWTIALCTFFAGRALAARRRWVYCVVVDALLAALCMPFGTILGVLSILVLVRPQVKAAFGHTA